MESFHETAELEYKLISQISIAVTKTKKMATRSTISIWIQWCKSRPSTFRISKVIPIEAEPTRKENVFLGNKIV